MNALTHDRLRWKLITIAAITLAMVAAGCSGPSPSPTPLTPNSASLTPTRPATSCARPFSGIAYGPYRWGQDPNLFVYPTAEEIIADFPTLAALTCRIRIYSSLGPAARIVQEAQRVGLSVNLGIWLRSESDEGGAEANRKEIVAGIGLMSNPAVDTVTVGNEVLLRGDLNEGELRQAIREVRTARDAGNMSVKITTADLDGQWLQHPDLATDVDFVTVHLYPFWSGVPIADAISKLDASFAQVTNAFPSQQVVIGETGWPSAGSSKGGSSSSARTSPSPTETTERSTTPASSDGAVGSPANQSRYLREFFAWAKQRKDQVTYYYFEAFDEDWKAAQEGEAGAHWGLYDSNGNIKKQLRGSLPAPMPETIQGRAYRNVFAGALSAGLDIGIDTSGQSRGWLTVEPGVLRLAYPSGQAWGAMFITVGKPVEPGKRPYIDMSGYKSLEMDLRLADANAKPGCVHVGTKDSGQPDDGSEVTVEQCLNDVDWRTLRVPLNAFVEMDAKQIYVLAEIIFGNSVGPIEVRNIRYIPNEVSLRNLAIKNIYSSRLSSGFSINVDTSGQKRTWLTEQNGILTLSYPSRQAWGAMFITVGTPVLPGNRPGVDLSRFTSIMLDMRLANSKAIAGCVQLGVKDRSQPDDGMETKVSECVSSAEWKTFIVPLDSFGGAKLKQLYVVLEVVYGKRVVGPVQLRNIRYASNA